MTRNMNKTIAKFSPLLICAGTVMGTPATAANVNEKFGVVGPFEIIRIYEGGGQDYTRCAASMGKGNGMLRISYTHDGKTVISVPGVSRRANLMMYVTPSGNENDLSFAAETDSNRSWAEIDNNQLKIFLRIKKTIEVQVGQSGTPGAKTFSWNIGNTSLTDVLAKVKQCVK